MKKLFGVLCLIIYASYSHANNTNFNALFPSGVWSQYSVGNNSDGFGKPRPGYRISAAGGGDLAKAISGKPGETQSVRGSYQNPDGRTYNSFSITMGECKKGKGFDCLAYYSASVNPVSSDFQLVRYNSTSPENSTLTSCTPDFDEKSSMFKEPTLKDCYTVERKSCNEFLSQDFDQMLRANLNGADPKELIQQCDRLTASLQAMKMKINSKFRASQKFIEADLTSAFDKTVSDAGFSSINSDSKVAPVKFGENNTLALLEYANKVRSSCITAGNMRIFETKAESDKRAADQSAYLKAIFSQTGKGTGSGNVGTGSGGASAPADGRK